MDRKLIYKENKIDGYVAALLLIYKKDSKKNGIPYWLLVLLILLLLALIAVFISSLFVLCARRPGLYREDCIRRSCAPGYGFKCINYTCLCPSDDYYFSKKCKLRKSFGEFCNNKHDQCKLGLICFNGKCTCNKEHYWNGKLCGNKVSFGENCEHSECMDSLMLVCDKLSKLCTCNTTRFWSDKACYIRRTLNEKCKDSNSCRDDQELLCSFGYCSCNSTYMYFNFTESKCVSKKSEDEICSQTLNCLGDMICSTSGTCQCSNSTTHYFDYGSLSCIPKTLNDTLCSRTKTCRSDLGLSCQNGLCQCSSPLFWHSGQCSNPLNYSQLGCTSDLHCQSSLSLICYGYPTTSACNCPTLSTVGMCDCPIDKYWDGSQCVSKLNMNQICNSSVMYECAEGLICDSCSSTCINTSICDPGWYPYNSKCYNLVINAGYTDCPSINPPKNAILATIDSTNTHNFILCHFGPAPSDTYVENISPSLSCSPPSTGDCYVLDGTTCSTHDCSHTHNALCEYNY